jgi:hypothetical protein
MVSDIFIDRVSGIVGNLLNGRFYIACGLLRFALQFLRSTFA